MNKLRFTSLFLTLLSFLYLSSAADVKGMPGGGGKENKLLLILVDGFSFSSIHDVKRDPFFDGLLRSGYLGAMTMRTLGGKGTEDEIATLLAGRRAKGDGALFHPFLNEDKGELHLFPPLKRKGSLSYGEGIGALLHEAGVSTALFLPEGGSGGRGDPDGSLQTVVHPGTSLVSHRSTAAHMVKLPGVEYHPGAAFVVDRNGRGRFVKGDRGIGEGKDRRGERGIGEGKDRREERDGLGNWVGREGSLETDDGGKTGDGKGIGEGKGIGNRMEIGEGGKSGDGEKIGDGGEESNRNATKESNRGEELHRVRFLVTEWHKAPMRPWLPIDWIAEKERFLSFIERMVRQFHDDREIWILPYRLDQVSVRKEAYLSPILILPRAKEELRWVRLGRKEGDTIAGDWNRGREKEAAGIARDWNRGREKEVAGVARDWNRGREKEVAGVAGDSNRGREKEAARIVRDSNRGREKEAAGIEGDSHMERGSRIEKTADAVPGKWRCGGMRRGEEMNLHWMMEGGVLTSPTTRRAGFVGNIDLYPAILSFFGLEDSLREGRPMVRIEGAMLQKEVLKEIDRSFEMHQMRRPFLYRLLFWMVGGVLLLLLLLTRSPSMGGIIHFLSVSLLTIPLLLLLFALFHVPVSLPIYEGWLLVGVTMISLLLLFFDVKRRYLFITSLYVSLFFFDGVLGHPMLTHSVLSYDPIIAARFYGIGNEYAGVLLGSGLLLLYLIAGEKGNVENGLKRLGLGRSGFALLLYLSILFYFLHPGLGADLGGALSWMVLPLIMVLRKKRSKQLSRASWFFMGGIVLLFLLSFSFLFLWGMAHVQKSHVGWLMAQASDQGIGVIAEVVKRKMEMNLKLLLHSKWNRLFFISILLLMGYLIAAGRRRIGETGDAELARASLWVNLAGFALNDSGIVTASLGLLFAVIPLLHGLAARKGIVGDPVH